MSRTDDRQWRVKEQNSTAPRGAACRLRPLSRTRRLARRGDMPLSVLPTHEHACGRLCRVRGRGPRTRELAHASVVSFLSGARRGFCNKCGSALFWEPTPTTHISISAGSLNPPTGLEVKEHIFLAQKGDYYEIPQDVDR